MRNAIYAVIAAAIIAALITFGPMLTSQVDAAPGPVGKSDRADARPLAGDCSEKAWPYVEATCLRDTRNPQGQAHQVRFVPLDNQVHRTGATAVALRLR
jgi:hypothetical protein